MAASFPKIETSLTQLLNIEFPIIMAPMFLVTNDKMMIEALNSGIAAAVPALNYRTIPELRNAINNIRTYAKGPIGINLIVNKSNIKYPDQLDCCVEMKVDFIITSLGSPEQVINRCKPLGIKVFCDVVDEVYAKKVEDLGADAVIAVNNEAGGHCGSMDAKTLIQKIKSVCKIPVVSAGGVGNGAQMFSRIESDGACGVSIGSPFIASTESPVSDDYKKACVTYGAKDIVLTTKISGTPCTVINTPYVQQIGTKQNWLEAMLSKNKTLKKYIKMLTYIKGMKAVEHAAMGATYKTVWVAGKTIEFVHEILPTKVIVERFISEYYEELGRRFNSSN